MHVFFAENILKIKVIQQIRITTKHNKNKRQNILKRTTKQQLP